MPIESCGQCVGARRGKRYIEIGLLHPMTWRALSISPLSAAEGAPDLGGGEGTDEVAEAVAAMALGRQSAGGSGECHNPAA
jgi:hypothetical protein